MVSELIGWTLVLAGSVMFVLMSISGAIYTASQAKLREMFLILAFLNITACAVQQTTWTGGDSRALTVQQLECQSNVQHASANGDRASNIFSFFSRLRVEEEAYTACMTDHGWTKVVIADR